MKLGYKHSNHEIIEYPKFDGGLNLLQSADAIEINQLARAENVEYDAMNGSLTKCSGTFAKFDAGVPITSIYMINDYFCLFSSGTSLYSSDLTSKTLLGTLAGNLVPCYIKFGDVVLVASGGTLQVFSTGVLSAVSGAPNSDYVFVRDGRVVVFNSGSDNLYFSAVGDYTSWTDNPNDASSAKWLQVGYKDGNGIICVSTLVQDIIVFKESGKTFRVTGSYPDWSVMELTNSAHCGNRFAAVQANNSLFFLGRTGFRAIQTVIEYGDMKSVDVGKLINSYLLLNIDPTFACVWYVSSRNQIWIQPQSTGLIYIYHCLTGAFTMRKMSTYISDVFEVGKKVYMTRGTKILELRSDLATDDGQEFDSFVSPKSIRRIHDILLTNVIVDIYTESSCAGVLIINNLSIPLNCATSGEIAALDEDIAALDEDPVTTSSYTTTTKRCVYRLKLLSPIIIISSGSLSLRKLCFMIAEV